MMKKINVDVVAVPLSGHLYPLMDLVQPLLEDERFEVRLFTGPQKADLAQSLGFKVLTFLPDGAEKIDSVANSEAQLNIITAYRQLSASLDLINEVSDFLLEEWQQNRPDIVVADFITLSAGLVCQQLGIPWITSMATQFAIESQEGPPCFFGGWNDGDSFWISFRNACGRKATRLAKGIVAFLLRKKTARYRFKLYNDKQEETIYSPNSILALGMQEVELKSGFPDHFIWAGPCCRSFEAVHTDLLQLDAIDQKKVLISCGTQLQWGKDNLVQIGLALGKTYPDYHFIVTLGNSQRMSDAPEAAADNVTVVQYLPYTHYIPQMDYVIHHGGAGVFYNCIQYGKPALILPHDYDQADFAVRGREAGIAYTAKRNNISDICQAFDQLVSRKDWPNLAALQAHWQDYQPTDTLIAEIERLLAKDLTAKRSGVT